jgi:hypothetical protein
MPSGWIENFRQNCRSSTVSCHCDVSCSIQWNPSRRPETDGDCLSAVALRAKIAATDKAFAWFCGDGKIVVWGDPYYGGDSSEVEQLQNIREV